MSLEETHFPTLNGTVVAGPSFCPEGETERIFEEKISELPTRYQSPSSLAIPKVEFLGSDFSGILVGFSLCRTQGRTSSNIDKADGPC